MLINNDFITLSVGDYDIFDSNGNYIDTLNKMQSDKCIVTNNNKFLVMCHATINQKLIKYFMKVGNDDILLKSTHTVIFAGTNTKGKMYGEFKVNLRTFRWDTEVSGFGNNMLVFGVREFEMRVDVEEGDK